MTDSFDQIIELKPEIDNHFICPECNTKDHAVKDVLLQQVYVLADCTCTDCGLEFYQTFSNGHSVEEHVSIKKSGKLYADSHNESWLSEMLSKSFTSNKNKNVPIEKRVFRECESVVVLNTLDYLYGHVL